MSLLRDPTWFGWGSGFGGFGGCGGCGGFGFAVACGAGGACWAGVVSCGSDFYNTTGCVTTGAKLNKHLHEVIRCTLWQPHLVPRIFTSDYTLSAV